MIDLPVTEVLNEIKKALSCHHGAVLQAPPGAGKTTVVPLALQDAPWLQKRRILMLAPRRLAARAAAGRMAHILGEKVGQTVGYRIRGDTNVGPVTRIEVLTEGVLTRMLQSDPSLDKVGLVIFDEFHERSLNADLAMALCLDIQGVLNADLKLLVMSATMDTGPVADMLGGVPVIISEGRRFPIETRYLGTHTPSNNMKDVAGTVLSAIRHEKGSILVFLPGAAEIRQVARHLQDANLGKHVRIVPLLGNLNVEAQNQAICAPAQGGYRKIVLATAIAETSLTIEGIHVVVDSGLQRTSRFDVRSGMSRLVTRPVSRASADQRRGRAGRLGPGICLRMWSKAVNKTLTTDRRPEIMEADLCGFALNLAKWGVHHPSDLKWLNLPPEGAYATALSLLQSLNALDHQYKITQHGRKMATMAVHPRLGHMLLMAHTMGQIRVACDLAALLTERDPLRFAPGQGDVDLQVRYNILQAHRTGKPCIHPSAQVNHHKCRHILNIAGQLYNQLKRKETSSAKKTASLDRLLAWAYPDRIAQRRPGRRGRYVMTGGQGVRLDESDPMAAESYIIAVETDGKRHDGRIYRAASYKLELLEEQYAHQLSWCPQIHWDCRHKAVSTQQLLKLGAITLQTRTLHQPDQHQVLSAMLDGIAQNGIGVLPWNKALRCLQARVCFLHKVFSTDKEWPDLSDKNLLNELSKWLAPYLAGILNLRALTRIDLRSALLSWLSYDQHQKLNILAPTHWTVPSGSKRPIDYSNSTPILAVRLQEMFGLEQTPVIAQGRQPLLLHLLSPAGRPVQVTQDLAGFWKNSYHDVKKELKGRYPKHYWPDDPLLAIATSRAKPKHPPSTRT